MERDRNLLEELAKDFVYFLILFREGAYVCLVVWGVDCDKGAEGSILISLIPVLSFFYRFFLGLIIKRG